VDHIHTHYALISSKYLVFVFCEVMEKQVLEKHVFRKTVFILIETIF